MRRAGFSALGVSFFLANSVLLLTHGQRYSYAAYQLGGNPNTGEPGFGVLAIRYTLKPDLLSLLQKRAILAKSVPAAK